MSGTEQLGSEQWEEQSDVYPGGRDTFGYYVFDDGWWMVHFTFLEGNSGMAIVDPDMRIIQDPRMEQFWYYEQLAESVLKSKEAEGGTAFREPLRSAAKAAVFGSLLDAMYSRCGAATHDGA